MNRRTFLRSLLALPFAAKAALSRPAPKIIVPADFDAVSNPKVWTVELEPPSRHLIFHNFNGPAPGCTLTRATIQPLSPADLKALIDQETDRATVQQCREHVWRGYKYLKA
jgi:hypothetical protein